MADLRGARALIVGGSSGIGFATASDAMARGMDVTIAGRDPDRLARALERLGPAARGEAVDAGDRAALNAYFGRSGPFDHLVLSASGGRGAGAFRELDAMALRSGFEGKFWPYWNSLQAALPHLAKDGSATLVTAASSRLANPGTSGLAAINGAIETLVPTLARELAPLRLNAVSPGVVDTPWWADKPAGLLSEMSSRAPLARPGRPDEIADAVLFLMGNRFVTGVVLDVDGGLHLT